MGHNKKHESGMSIIELLTVLFIVSVISGSVVTNIKEINRPLTNASFEITHFLRLARAKAISQTQFVKVSPLSLYKIMTYSGSSCEDATVANTDLSLDLPNYTSLISNSWSICYTPRGLSESSESFQIRDEHENTRNIETALGGGVRIQ